MHKETMYDVLFSKLPARQRTTFLLFLPFFRFSKLPARQRTLNAVRSAAWFWQSRNCGQYADDIQRVTQLINGGNNGINDRKARFELAKRELQL